MVLANELECAVVLVPFDKIGVEYPKIPNEETTKNIKKIIEVAEGFGCVGNIALQDSKMFGFLFPYEKDKDNTLEFFQVMQEKQLAPKIAKNLCHIDKRYIKGGIYEGFSVALPPQFLDNEIRSLLAKYSDDFVVKQDIKSSCLIYELKLWGDIGIAIIYNPDFLGGGFGKGNETYCTDKPNRDYKKILSNIKLDTDRWISEHPNINLKA